MTSSMTLVVLKASIAMLVFGVGLKATPADALYLVRRPGLFLRTILAMHVAMPLLAAWACARIALHPAVAIALIALAISPVPPFLPGKVARAEGDDSYMFGLVVTTSLLAVVAVPASLAVLGGVFHLPGETPTKLVFAVVAETLLLPMALGLTIAHFIPATKRGAKVITTIASLTLVAAFLPLVLTIWPVFKILIGDGTLLAIVALTLAGLAIGHSLGGPRPEHRTVLALATSARHPAVAIVIATAEFPGNPLIVSAVLLALIVSALTTAPYVAWSRHHARHHRTPTEGSAGGIAVTTLHVRPSRNKQS